MLVASSYDDKQVLVFGPAAGYEVPILLNLEKMKFDVRLPNAHELDQHFRREKSISALKLRFPESGAVIDAMCRLSREATRLFSEDELDDFTILDMRKRVQAFFSQRDQADATEDVSGTKKIALDADDDPFWVIEAVLSEDEAEAEAAVEVASKDLMA